MELQIQAEGVKLQIQTTHPLFVKRRRGPNVTFRFDARVGTSMCAPGETRQLHPGGHTTIAVSDDKMRDSGCSRWNVECDGNIIIKLIESTFLRPRPKVLHRFCCRNWYRELSSKVLWRGAHETHSSI